MKRDKLAAGVGCANTRNDVDKRTPEPLGGGFRHLVVHCRRGEKYDTYVGRKCAGAPAGCDGGWGNPLRMTRSDSGERTRVIAGYRAWLAGRPELVARARSELRGKVLACWCAPHDCHATATCLPMSQTATRASSRRRSRPEPMRACSV